LHQSFPVLGLPGVAAALISVILFNVAFEFLWRLGERVGRRSLRAGQAVSPIFE
jgi:hypothetical protein